MEPRQKPLNLELEYVFNMIKRTSYLLGILFCLIACNSESVGDCFQTEGAIIEKSYDLATFSEIRIVGEVSLVIKQGDVQEVLLETGENLLNDVYVSIEDETLIIKDENKCNLFRDYGLTKATVTVPNLVRIRNSSTYDVHSEGVLQFPELILVSNTSGGIEDVRKGGDFYINVECEELLISANGQSVFYINGHANKATISFTDENPRFEGRNLMVNVLEVSQVSANDMIVNPQEEIFGSIRGTGNVISVHRPEIVDVEEIFTGRLLFQD